MRGFRIVIQDQTAASRLEAGHFDKMFQYAACQEVAICPLINPDFLAQRSAACARYPETTVFEDHLARSGAVGPVRERLDFLSSADKDAPEWGANVSWWG